jgi:hypothetical protein
LSPVPELVMTTDTPGRTAPEESVTVPRTLAVTPPCANTGEPNEIRNRPTKTPD